jgi:hypothetical protein
MDKITILYIRGEYETALTRFLRIGLTLGGICRSVDHIDLSFGKAL